MEHIDVIFYINLAHRKDRLEHIQKEIGKLCQDSEKVHRIEAFYTPENGALGCAMSHVYALEKFRDNPSWNTCLIFEDDFKFRATDLSENNEKIRNIINSFPDWNAISLAYNPENIQYTDTEISVIKKVVAHQIACGYILRKGPLCDLLIPLFKKCVFNLKKTGNVCIFNIDQAWKRLQTKFAWYTTYPSIGVVIDGYSDIANMNVVYDW
ncbi:MAG: hypothetical protein EBT86_00010 [Actinobacteria bacterium]|nr:hypothetical protein [Actinomycetota bacterium]